MNIKLTSDQIALFRDQGFLQLDALTTLAEIKETQSIYDDLFSRKVGRDTGNQFDLAGTDDDAKPAKLPQLMNPAQYAPQLTSVAFRRAALSIAHQLLGGDAIADDEHAILKPAGDGAETPWHQDEAYWSADYEYEALSIWMPLQDATFNNGCLHFLPRSHKFDVVAHRPIGGDARVHGLEVVDPIDESHAVACPVSAGGCTIHHCRTLHYAGANATDQPRRAYIMTFTLPRKRRKTPRRFIWLETRQTARLERLKKT